MAMNFRRGTAATLILAGLLNFALMANADAVTISFLKNLDPKAIRTCNTNYTCDLPVLVSEGGFTDTSMSTWNAELCSAYFPYASIEVPSRKKPRLKWAIVKGPADRAKYRFHASDGVKLTDNDPNKDLYENSWEDPDGTSFKWHNRHSQNTEVRISFVFVIYRIEADGSKVECNNGDPTIVNKP